MQPYLLSTKISTRKKKYLFLFRTRMMNVGHNYGRKVPCPLCKSENGDMFNCVIMKISCRELFMNNETKYEDIFSPHLQKLINVAKLCESLARKRREILA